jgi:hypothetical protein
MSLVDRINSKETLKRLDDMVLKLNIAKPLPDTPLYNIKQVCKKNNYMLIDFNSNDPEVVLLGDFHPNNIHWFSDELENIISSSIEKDDTLLMEGANGGKILLPCFNVQGNYINNIILKLKKLNVTTCFNDLKELTNRLGDLIPKLPKNYDKLSSKEEGIVQEVQELHDLRDENFVFGHYGISKFKGRKYQVVGQGH